MLAYRTPLNLWLLPGLAIGLLMLGNLEALSWMESTWRANETYSHGYLIPFISLFLIWQHKPALQKLSFQGSWLGIGFLVLASLLMIMGELATLYIVIQYAMIFMLFGLAWCWLGWAGIRLIWLPLLFLTFMIPLPDFLYQGLSGKLQLISSAWGVQFIRACNISVFLEGNVIDLGSFQLQVVEACSGLRYLFPLMSLSFICAYFYQGAFWKRALIFLSSMPVTVLMNSLRIGITGLLVEYWGIDMAQGFMHDFEGWVIFLACMGILIGEMWLLTQIGVDKIRPLRSVFGMDFPEPMPADTRWQSRRLPRQLLVGVGVMALTVATTISIGQRDEVTPQRQVFERFPMQLQDWAGDTQVMDAKFIKTLKFDDYILADYRSHKQPFPLNFYVAYYGSQTKGRSAHSPRACIPGGGWKITSLTTHTVPGVQMLGQPLRVNRVEISKGDNKQLLYYWFQQRDRVVVSEYAVKWYLLWDAITRNRTDGALIRLAVPVQSFQDITKADAALADFARNMLPVLPNYVPG